MGKPYRECPHCGAHLDAGERCDCGEPEQQEQTAAEERPRMRLIAVCREVDKDTGRIAIYYGCADTCVGMAFTKVDEVVDYIKKHSSV